MVPSVRTWVCARMSPCPPPSSLLAFPPPPLPSPPLPLPPSLSLLLFSSLLLPSPLAGMLG
eukprot:11689368-Karenia_brevis.AAC.1